MYEKIVKGSLGIEGCGLVSVVFTQNPADKTQIIPVSSLKAFLLSHSHLDHLPAAENLYLIVPDPIVEKVRKIYLLFGLRPKIIRHSRYVETYHYGITRTGKITKVPSYCLVFEDFVFIPESDEQRKLLKMFESFEHGAVCRVPRADAAEKPVQLEDIPKGWYLVDNKALVRFFGRVIPKCVPTICDGAVIDKQQRARKL